MTRSKLTLLNLNRCSGISQLSFPCMNTLFRQLPIFSSLQRNLFFRLVKDKPSERYTAAQALRHPWITRQKTDGIPLTVHEELEHMEIESKLRKRMLAVLFLSICKK